jgi:hypothetical protein
VPRKCYNGGPAEPSVRTAVSFSSKISECGNQDLATTSISISALDVEEYEQYIDEKIFLDRYLCTPVPSEVLLRSSAAE